MKLRLLVVFCLLFSSQSCVTPHRMAQGIRGISGEVGMTDSHRVKRSNNWVLARGSQLFVAFPRTELFDADLLDQIVTAFRQYCPASARGDSRESYQQALISASQLNSDYLVYPQLMSRDENTGLWEVIMTTLPYSEKQRADIKLRLTLYAVDTGKIVDQALLQGRGGFFTAADKQVELLLAAPLDEYVRGMFR